VLFDGVDVTDLPTEERHIAQVFQFPVVYDTMTVYDNLAFPLRNLGQDEATVKARVLSIAEMLEMTDVLNKKARSLTADAKQKISLGRGLVRENVAAILFDEPLTVIDPHLKWLLRMQIKALHQRLNRTMIYVTHDQTEALTFADKVVVMHDGHVVQIGTPEELFDKPKHTFVGYFIGSPGMNFIDVKISGSQAMVADDQIELESSYRLRSSDKVELGIRPEFVSLSLEPSAGSLNVSVKRIEDIGRHKIVRVDFNGHEVSAIVPEGVSITEEFTNMTVDKGRINIYSNDWLVEGGEVS
jgi:glycerol transport system ATP-binding protein